MSEGPSVRDRELAMFDGEGIAIAKEQMRVLDGFWQRIAVLMEGDNEAVAALLAGYARTMAASMPGADARALLEAMVSQVPNRTEKTEEIVTLAHARLALTARLGTPTLKPTES